MVMATGDQTPNEVSEALDRDFRFNLALLQNLFQNLPATLDEQKILRWITRLTVEPREGHTDTSRRIRNSYLKLIVLNVQQGYLDPQIDKKEPPEEREFLPPLQIQSPTSTPVWLQKMTPADDNDMKILLELSRDVTQSEVVAGKDPDAKKHKKGPVSSLKNKINIKKEISATRGNRTQEPAVNKVSSAREFGDVNTSGDSDSGERVSDYLQGGSQPLSPLCAGDNVESKPTKRHHKHKTQLRKANVKEYLDRSLDLGINPVAEEKLKNILPLPLLEDFRVGLAHAKSDIRDSHFKKMNADLNRLTDLAKAILHHEKENLNIIRNTYFYFLSLDKMLRKAERVYLTKVQELEKRAIRKGFLGVTNSERLRNAVTTLQNLRAQKERLLSESTHLDREWNTVRLKWMVRNLRTAMGGTSSNVRSLLTRRFPHRIRSFRY